MRCDGSRPRGRLWGLCVIRRSVARPLDHAGWAARVPVNGPQQERPKLVPRIGWNGRPWGDVAGSVGGVGVPVRQLGEVGVGGVPLVRVFDDAVQVLAERSRSPKRARCGISAAPV